MPFFPPSGGGGSSPAQIRFDVRDYGAVGNGSADDAPAIQAAMDAAFAAATDGNKCNVYVPQGNYKCNTTLNLRGGIRFWGDGWCSRITGNDINGYVFEDALDSSFESILENIAVTNGGVHDGGGYRIGQNKAGIQIKNVFFAVDGKAVTTEQADHTGGAVFGLTITDCKFLGCAYGIDISTGGSYVDLRNDIQQCAVGRRICGAGAFVNGGRMEANDVANVFGVDPAGGALALTGSLISSIELEANNVTFDLQNLNCVTISDMAGGTWGEIIEGVSNPRIGIDIGNCTDVTLRNLTPGGNYTTAAIRSRATNPTVTLDGVQASNDTSGVPAWDFHSNINACRFTNCNFPVFSADSVKDLQRSVHQTGLGNIDFTVATKDAANLSGTVTVTNGSTTAAVLFPAAEDASLTLVNSLTAQNGGSLTALGAYHYLATLVTETGETQSGAATTASTLTGSNRTFLLSLSSHAYSTKYRKRIYRGTGLTGDYQGYWDMPLNTNTTSFTDDGTIPFDGTKQPPAQGSTTLAAAEPDANYAVIVTPKWDTRVWVTSLATTGFTLNFSTGPSGDTALGWMIHR